MKRVTMTILGLTLLTAGACATDSDSNAPGAGSATPDDGSGSGTNTQDNPDPEPTALDDRKVDYNEALRTASLKLTDSLPRLADIIAVRDASNPQEAYEERLTAMLDDARFSRRMIRYWRDVLRQGGGELDSAPTFAARVLVEGRPFTDLLTATESTCPSYDTASESFVDGDCDNGVETHAGLLTNPGVMAQFYSNMAFRRVRWVQEIFACQSFPAEFRESPTKVGEEQATYTSPWDFDSVSAEPVDFSDTSSVVCANCHTSMNHLAPLFAQFDDAGMWQDSIQVETPLSPEPVPTELSHWLVDGEETAWRLGEPTANLSELGEAMAQDPAVAECLTARLYNFAMSKQDIVSELATIPVAVLEPYVKVLKESDGDLGHTLKTIMKSEDFVRF